MAHWTGGLVVTYLVTIIRGGHTITEEVDAHSQDQARQIMREEIEEDEDLEGYTVSTVKEMHG